MNKKVEELITKLNNENVSETYIMLSFEYEIPSNEDDHIVKGKKVISKSLFDALTNDFGNVKINYDNLDNGYDVDIESILGEEGEGLITIDDYLDFCEPEVVTKEEFLVLDKFGLIDYGTHHFEGVVNSIKIK